MSHEEELRDRPHPIQIEIWKKMSPFQRFQISEQLRVGAIELRSSYLRSRHPSITEEELKQKIDEFILSGTG
ncbi:MAG: hypothetical protein QF444_04625 [Phycisphaerales bacterium]|jgi:hypothetical protein|nr:hypothetical protein [Phycisphaerales bacterium]MDP6693592.1 hypothetical protein [Phycisphaerales bacterium]